jgi:hypothetical protein
MSSYDRAPCLTFSIDSKWGHCVKEIKKHAQVGKLIWFLLKLLFIFFFSVPNREYVQTLSKLYFYYSTVNNVFSCYFLAIKSRLAFLSHEIGKCVLKSPKSSCFQCLKSIDLSK